MRSQFLKACRSIMSLFVPRRRPPVYAEPAAQAQPAVRSPTSTDLDQLRRIDPSRTYTSALREIEVLISEDAESVQPCPSGDGDVHLIRSIAWQDPEMTPRMVDMIIVRSVPKNVEPSVDFPPLSMHRLLVIFSEDNTHALLVEISKEPATSKHLAYIHEQRRDPVTITTRMFGTLRGDRSHRIMDFNGEVERDGRRIQLTIQGEETAEVPSAKAMETAEALWNDLDRWLRKANERIVQDLWTVFDEGWRGDSDLDDGDPRASVRTPEQFVGHMQLGLIHVERNRDFVLWYDPGELFTDHSVQVYGNIDKGITAATF